MIIVEGPDLAGKTTLCERILEHMHRHGYPYVPRHLSRLPYCFLWQHYYNLISPFVVQDRFHLSEIPYAKVRGDVPILDSWSYQIVDGWLKSVGAVQVVLIPTPEVLEARWRKDEMYTLEQVQEVRANYLVMTNDRNVWYDAIYEVTDPDKGPNEEFIEDLCELAMKRHDYVESCS